MRGELKLWPLLYADFRYWWKWQHTSHHEPQKWKARPDFKRFDLSIVRTESLKPYPTPPGWRMPRMPWRLWVYRKDAAGVIWGWHFDWLWFPPTRLCFGKN